MTKNGGPRVLVVDDNLQEATRVGRALSAAGYQVSYQADSLGGLIAVETEQPDVVVLDWGLPFIDGAIFIYALRTGLTHPPPVLVLVDMGEDVAEVERAGATAWLPASAEDGELVGAVRGLLGESGTPARNS